MVMDANQPQPPPSPQSVGREFVRQYYTLLNKAPHHLYRFYNSQSSFIHDESTLVVGQNNIFNRIQQLNFHDCHAKISQVDAQATLGNGVVLQVTGELSNDGQPMRRFTQTFVLAAQTPKNYYVHNDIFRYQDLYAEDDNDVESRSEQDEESDQASVICVAKEVVPAGNLVAPNDSIPLVTGQVMANANNAAVITQQQTVAAAQPQQQPIYYSMPAGGPTRPLPVLNQAPTGAQVQPQYPTNAVPLQQAGLNQLNGLVAHEDIIGGNGLPPQQQQQQQPQQQQPLTQVTVLSAQNATLPVANAAAMPQNANQISGFQQTPIIQPQQQQQPPQQQQQPPPIQQQQQPQQQPTPVQAILTQPQHQPQPQQQQQPQPQPQQHLPIVNTVEEESNYQLEQQQQPQQHTIPTPSIVAQPIVDDFKTINEQQQQEKYVAAKQQQNEPKTYANLFKSSSSPSPSGFVNAMQAQQQQIQNQQQQHQQQQHQQQQQQINNNNNNNINAHNTTTSFPPQNNNNISSSSYSQSNNNNSNNNNAYNNRNNDNSLHRMDNNNMSGGQGSLPQRNSRMNKDFDQRRPSNAQFVDNQQLFLGNIPHHATEDELKKLFNQFGVVLELRILSKTPGKTVTGIRNPLNYGFITYQDADAVQNCLSNCPLYFPDNSPDGQKLNVEEKKPRLRNDLPPKQFMSSNINNQRNMSGGPQSRSLSGNAGGSGGGGSSGGGVLRGSGNSGNMSRGGNTGRISGGSFNRNDNRSGTTNGGGSQLRGGNTNTNNNAQSSGGNYGNRR